MPTTRYEWTIISAPAWRNGVGDSAKTRLDQGNNFVKDFRVHLHAPFNNCLGSGMRQLSWSSVNAIARFGSEFKEGVDSFPKPHKRLHSMEKREENYGFLTGGMKPYYCAINCMDPDVSMHVGLLAQAYVHAGVYASKNGRVCVWGWVDERL